jgi:hypothetical protein
VTGRGLQGALHSLDVELLPGVPVSTGVYEIVDEGGRTVDLAYAGGRSTFGLRGALGHWLHEHGSGGHHSVRWQVATVYLPRYDELLMAHVAAKGALPPMVMARGEKAPGRLNP